MAIGVQDITTGEQDGTQGHHIPGHSQPFLL
ncbi:hypothetical protein EDC27_3039 [Desulfosoma caldarium]|uniref:Uncharacterized protein n=1 Tax=Desulfosoma caldarium TaxID=610254 RepID=A0A3N1UJH5_9BACT|nr:hypothetical protein EDC27_3039 [Desulfosoma caldarium]